MMVGHTPSELGPNSCPTKRNDKQWHMKHMKVLLSSFLFTYLIFLSVVIVIHLGANV